MKAKIVSGVRLAIANELTSAPAKKGAPLKLSFFTFYKYTAFVQNSNLIAEGEEIYFVQNTHNK